MNPADDIAEAMIAAGLSRKSIAVYTSALRRIGTWCAGRGTTLETITASELREYAEGLPRTRSSRQLLRASLQAYWAALGLPEGPVGAIRVPSKPRMRCRALEPSRAGLLAKAAGRRGDAAGLAVLLGLYAGLRRAEIAGLRWRDIGEDGWLTVVGKMEITRSLPLHPAILAALAGTPRSGVWIFPGRWGGPTNPTTVWGWVRQVSTEAGLDVIQTHVLRHTALATSLDNCRDLRAVQELAGHARPETTAGYTRVTTRRLELAVDAIEYS